MSLGPQFNSDHQQAVNLPDPVVLQVVDANHPAHDPVNVPPPTFGFKRVLLLTTAFFLAVSLLGIAGLIITKNQSDLAVNQKDSYATSAIPISEVTPESVLGLAQLGQLDINGRVQVNGALVLTPQDQPTEAKPGAIYYDKTTSQVYYFNGSEYRQVADAQSTVTSIGGISGALTLGQGLSFANGVLSANIPTQSTTAVTSVQGQIGAVSFLAGTGVSISGTTIANTGVTSFGGANGALTVGRGLSVVGNNLASTAVITSGSLNILVTDNGNGNYTISDTGSGGGGQVALGPIAAQNDPTTNPSIFVDKTGAGDLLRLLTNGSNTFVVDNNGLITNGTIAYTQVTGRPVSTVTNVGGASGAIIVGSGLGFGANTITNAGVLSLTGTANQVSVSGATGNVTLTLPQSIAATSSPTFATLALTSALSVGNGGTGATTPSGARTNLGAAASGANGDITSLTALTVINPGAALAVGNTGQSLLLQGNASTVVTSTNGGFTSTLNFVAPTANNTISLPDASGTVCLSIGNCPSSGVGGGGTVNTIALFSGATAVADSIITQNGGGTIITITGGLSVTGTISGNGSGLTSLNGTNISSGTVADARLSSNVTIQGNTFNGNNQLVQLTAGGLLPTLNASNLTTLNASALSSGTVADARLTSNVTLQGNTFNGASQLVQLNGSTQLPAISGALLTSLNATNVSSGTLADARLSTNVTLQGNSFNGGSQLVQLNGSSQLPAVSGVNLTNLNGSNISSGTVGVGFGGTGSGTAGGARTNLGAAASGANGDITSLTALTVINPGAALTIGNTGQDLLLQGSATTSITSTNGGFTSALVFQSPSANATITVPNITGTVCLSTGNCLGGGGGGANTALSNLTSVSINTSLLPGNTTIDLGSNGAPFNDLYIGSAATTNFRFTGVATATRTITLPDATGTLCLSTGNCAGAGSGITGSGTANTISMFSAGQNIVDSIITQNGGATLVTITGGLTVTGVISGDGSGLTTLNGTNISSGTVADARLSSNVTTQGNTFNGNTQLVQTNGSGQLPALSGVNVTALNGSNIASGTVADARLTSNVTLQGNTFNGNNQLVQLNGSGFLPALNGAALTSLNATNISSGTVAVSVGGTGITSYTTGDLIYASAATTLSTIAAPAAGQCLVSNGVGVAPSWGSCVGGSGAVTAIGALDGQTKNANAATIASNTLYLQTADATYPGVVSAAAQTFAGDKTFTGAGSFTGAGTSLAITNNLTVGGTINTASISGGTVTGGTLNTTSVNGVTTADIVLTTGSYADPAWITSLAKSKVGLANVENTALSTWAGTTNLITLGTVTTGTWQASVIADTYINDTLTVGSGGTVDWAALNNYPAACGAGTAVTTLGDSITCTAFASSSGSGSYIQNQNASQQSSSNFWLSGTGRADNSFTTPLLDTPTASVLNIGTTNASQINLNKNTLVTGNISFVDGADRTISVNSQTTSNTAGNRLNVQAGAGNGTGAGGRLFLAGGQGGSSGNGGELLLVGGPTTSATSTGGQVTIFGGDGFSGGAANGGNVLLSGGLAWGAGVSGQVLVRGQTSRVDFFQIQGAGLNVIFNVDDVNRRVGLNTAAPSYDLSFGAAAARTIRVETQTASNTAGNALTVQAATGNGTGAGGSTTIQGGIGGATGAGGNLELYAGYAGGGNSTGGNALIYSGQSSGSGNAGAVFVVGGQGGDTGNGGLVQITGGIAGTAGGNAGSVTIQGGQGWGGNSNGGDVTLVAGIKSGTGTFGSVIVKPGISGNKTDLFQVQNAAGSAFIIADSTNKALIVKAGTDAASLGSEMANNTFNTTWTSGGGWTLGASSATHVAGTANTLEPTTPLSISAGSYYQVSYQVAGLTAGYVNFTLGGVTGSVVDSVTTTSQVIKATTTGNLIFTPLSAFDGVISNVSVRLITTVNAALSVQNTSSVANLEVRASSSNTNLFVGVDSGVVNVSGTQNAAFGTSSLQSNTTGSTNSAFGYTALRYNTTGSGNTASGAGALLNNTTGSTNSAFGSFSLGSNTSGSGNTALGWWSAIGSTTGSYNVSVGYGTLFNNGAGSRNTAIGTQAGQNFTGSYNTSLGDYAGTGEGSFFTSFGTQYATAIGAGAQVQASDSLVLGRISTQTKVGIGTTIPLNTFSVSPVYYSTGTAYQSTTTITGVGTTWTAAMVGMQFIFSSGETAIITGFTNATTLTAGTSQTVSSNPGVAYRIHTIGLQVANTTGRVGIGAATPSYDLSFGSGANRTIQVETQTISNTAGNSLTISSGIGNGTGAGGDLTVLAGQNGGTAGNGGALSLYGGGAVTAGTGGASLLKGGDAGTGNGGNATLQAGSSWGGGNGGDVIIHAGIGGAGGRIIAKSAIGGDRTNAFQVQNGASTAILNVDTVNSRIGINTATPSYDLSFGGIVGTRYIRVENQTASNTSGAALFLGAANGNGSGAGGNISLYAGDNGSGAGAGGNVDISAGTGITSNGGTVQVYAGVGSLAGGSLSLGGGAGFTGGGGAVSIFGGAALTSGTAGAVLIGGGAAFNGVGGGVVIQGGTAAGSNQNGSNISLTTGARTGTGTSGQVTVKPGVSSDKTTLFQVQNAASTVILNVDTVNNRIGINTATPSYDLSFGTGANRTIQVETPTASNTSGNSLTVQAATGNGTANGGGLNLNAGAAGTSGAGGSVSVSAGAGANGPGGGLFLVAGSASSGNGAGGDTWLTSGGGSGTGNSGSLVLLASAAGATGAGGNVLLNAGSGGSTSGIGGNVTINGGAAQGGNSNGGAISLISGRKSGTGTGGVVVVKAGTSSDRVDLFQVQNAAGTAILNVDTVNSRIGLNTATPSYDLSFGASANRTIQVETQTTSNTAGNHLFVYAATGNGTGSGGITGVYGGNGGLTGAGGGLNLLSGSAGGGNNSGGATVLGGGNGSGTGNGGQVTVQAGTAGSTGTGGNLFVYGGNGGTTSGNGGAVSINGGAPLTSGTGGAVSINGGNSLGTNQNGGDITLTAGAKTGTGTGGSVIVKPAASGDKTNFFQIQNAGGTAFFTADSTNSTVTVTNLVITASLTVNGHIISGNASGSTTVAAGAAACTTPTVTIAGNDTAGVITVVTGTGCAAGGTLATVTFSAAFGTAPAVVVTPQDSASAALQTYATQAIGTFVLGSNTTATDTTTYKYNYLVVQ